MLKMGGYGLLRFNLPLFPEGAEDWAWIIIALSIIAHHLRRVGRARPTGHEEADRLFIGQPYGIRDTGNLHEYLHDHRGRDLNGINGSMMVMLAHGFNTGGLFLWSAWSTNALIPG